MALKFLNIIIVLMTWLLIFRHGASKELVKFERSFNYSSNSKITVKMTSSKRKIVGKNVAVKCPLLISFGHQTGIYTCQKDRLQYLVPTSNVQVTWFAVQPKRVKLYCDNMKDIIKGEELNISCKMNRNYTIRYKVIIGWIQGKYNITRTLRTDTDTVRMNQTLKGFHSGEGVFFYCILNNRNIYCYTLILTVHLQLKVDVKRLYSETPQIDVNQHCFKCYAEGGSDDKKMYNWSLNKEELTENDDQLETDERCFSNLPAGDYTVKCLVSTDVQNRSNEIAFTIQDTYTKKPKIKILLVTSNIIWIAVLVCVVCFYEQQKRKHHNTPAPVVHFQRSADTISARNTSDVLQINAEDEVPCSVDDRTAEQAEQLYVNSDTVIEKKRLQNARNENRETAERAETTEQAEQLYVSSDAVIEKKRLQNARNENRETAERAEQLYVCSDTVIEKKRLQNARNDDRGCHK